MNYEEQRNLAIFTAASRRIAGDKVAVSLTDLCNSLTGYSRDELRIMAANGELPSAGEKFIPEQVLMHLIENARFPVKPMRKRESDQDDTEALALLKFACESAEITK
ncbi:MAG: hypothetical protein KDE57_12975 [Calditrichaeota bacterium]|nr:hypothetical protein [Calditrichota bacterium]MCB0287562.1 hypothetical protein [Calditrichota bacterium]